jgi:hexosaminidase
VEGAFRAVAPWGRGGGTFDAGGRVDQREALDLAPMTDVTDERTAEQREARRYSGVRYEIPAVRIEDEPRFGYRGMHLDVGRHLFPVEFVLEYIDLLAMYRMSAFHWHLTEDQGWRIAIDAYPRLTEIAAWRDETMVGRNFDPRIGDGRRYGGWYTKEEVRRVVEYAAERHITVIPEIELPGHSSAAVAAYPELGCRDEADGVATGWGIFEDIYCPNEATFAFLENVLDEVLELFPSPYIHIGGDEAPKTAWEESEFAQDLMAREGLADEQELQSWFIQRIERYLLERDRRLIGWDEILEGGLAPEATVMSWRGTAGGIEAAQQGHDVIMTPTGHAYFDYYQGEQTEEAAAAWEPGIDREPLAIGGYLPLEQVYAFEPVPEELTPEQARFILGAQGNVWTEYIPTPSHVEYMILPRMPAMAEVGWSAPERRDFADFERRLGEHTARWRALGVNYRDPGRK